MVSWAQSWVNSLTSFLLPFSMRWPTMRCISAECRCEYGRGVRLRVYCGTVGGFPLCRADLRLFPQLLLMTNLQNTGDKNKLFCPPN